MRGIRLLTVRHPQLNPRVVIVLFRNDDDDDDDEVDKDDDDNFDGEGGDG